MGGKGNLTDSAANQIIQLILDNNMQPGDKLPNEYELAEQLGVGRSTLREATRRLVSRNVLVTRQGAGTFVSKKCGIPEDPLGLTFIENGESPGRLALELSDIRLMLEPEIAELAAVHATEASKAKLVACCETVEEQIQAGGDYSKADTALHRCIAECSGNSVLENLIPIIASSVNASIQATGDKFRNLTYDQHRTIVNAILRGDAAGAKYAMVMHLNTSREEYAVQNR